MTKSRFMALASSILIAGLCLSTPAQQKGSNSSRADLAIEIGGSHNHQVPASEGGYIEISPPPRRSDAKPSGDSPPLTRIRLHPAPEGDGVRVKIGAVFDDSFPVDAPGPKYGEKEEIIASYLAYLGETVTVNDLERFGFEALKFKVVLYQPPDLTDKGPSLVIFPKVVNELKSVGVVDWRPDARNPTECRLVLKNLSSQDIVSFTLQVNNGFTETMQASRAKPLAKPGGTFEEALDFGEQMVDSGTIVSPKAVLFGDLSFEGDVEAAAAMAGRLRGREIQMGRFLQLLHNPSPADAPATEILQNLKLAVERLRIDVDPGELGQLQPRFPLPDGKRKMIAEQIMESLKLARWHAINMLGVVERERSENPQAFDLRRALAAIDDRVAKWVEPR